MQDPFGADDNDLALVHYHDVFAQVRTLTDAHTCAHARLRPMHMHTCVFMLHLVLVHYYHVRAQSINNMNKQAWLTNDGWRVSAGRRT